MQSRPPQARSESGDGRSLSPRRPAPSRRKRGALGEGAAGGGGGAEAGASATRPAWAAASLASWLGSCVGSFVQRVSIVKGI